MSEIIQIRLKENQAFNIFGHQTCFLSEHTSVCVLMTTWHLWAAVSHWGAYKQ